MREVRKVLTDVETLTAFRAVARYQGNRPLLKKAFRLATKVDALRTYSTLLDYLVKLRLLSPDEAKDVYALLRDPSSPTPSGEGNLTEENQFPLPKTSERPPAGDSGNLRSDKHSVPVKTDEALNDAQHDSAGSTKVKAHAPVQVNPASEAQEPEPDGNQKDPTAGAKTQPPLSSGGGGSSTISLAPTMKALDAPYPPPKVEETDDLQEIGGYRLLRKIGQGGMCAVYLGFRIADPARNIPSQIRSDASADHGMGISSQAHQKVAIKILPPSEAETKKTVDRFYQEATSGAQLNHPNIVKNLGFGQDRKTGLHYLVLEYVDGPSAMDLLETQGPLSVPDAVHITLEIAHGLEHAHAHNIIHRDIKPDNILITKTGIPKLADMGLAKRTDQPSHLTAARQAFGTPYYMPYEQALSAKTVDEKADIYALGATLYHLATGRVPFDGDSHVEIVD